MTRSGRKPQPVADSTPVELTIDRIDGGGDGAAAHPDGGGTVHVGRTLPGERVLARILQPNAKSPRAGLVELLSTSQERVDPPCVHFPVCGGCALQHWADAPYAAWKRGLVTEVLKWAGFETGAVGALLPTPPAARRRMDLAILRDQGHLLLGLHAAHSKDIVDFTECQVMHPALFALTAPLRGVLNSLTALRRHGSLLANLLDDGPDLLLRTDGPLSAGDRTRLANFATAHNVPRIAWATLDGTPEIAMQAAVPGVSFAGQRVYPPPGAFLQASHEGQAAIVAAVVAGLPDKLLAKAHAVELFAGCGTLSFPLAERLRVHAFEGEAGAVAALRRAAGGNRIVATQRDLVRQPITIREFKGASAIVLDPPYAGAAMQMPAIAASGVDRVIYVSCNPQALGRDAAVLRKAGYRLWTATPIDQFLWSAHVECVAVFERT